MDLGESAKYIGIIAASLEALHLGYMVGGTFLQRTGPKISSQEELDSIAQEVARSLGIDRSKTGIPITTSYSETDERKANEFGIDSELNFYPPDEVDGDRIKLIRQIELGGRDATRKMVRHEEYHFKHHLKGKGKADSKKNLLEKIRDCAKYYFWEEPAAIFYGLTGVELSRAKVR